MAKQAVQGKPTPAMGSKGKSKASTAASASKTPKLYSSFNPIAITIPSPIPVPVPSSSKRPLSSITHYIYVRPHRPSVSSETGVTGRTVFITNLPVDIGERELRAVFGTWGVVEEVSIGKGETGDTLEKAVQGSLEEEEDSEEDEEEEDEEEEEEEEEEEQDLATGERPEANASEPQFVPNEAVVLTRAEKQRLRRKRRRQIPPSVPEVTPLPATNPRTTPFGPSGSHIVHITFLDAVSVERVMAYTGQAIPLPSTSAAVEPTGLAYYTKLHSSLRPAAAHVKAFADSSMDRYDHLHSLLLSSRAKKKGAGALVDEDGFTVVVRGGRYGRTGGRGDLGSGSVGVGVARKGVAPKEAKGGAAALTDFYKFQKVDRKRKELADLRKKFDQDKAKVDELKRSKRFKPY